MKHIYGISRTHLNLAEKAKEFYNATDPLFIEEMETEDGYRYNLDGAFVEHDLTEEELIAVLEGLADELNDTEEE